MPEKYIDIQSISDLLGLYSAGKPKHPLISVVDLAKHQFIMPAENHAYRLGFYCVFCKNYLGSMRYGRSNYDFNEGSLVFTAPGQVSQPGPAPSPEEGWGLFFHPDLLHGTLLGKKLSKYSFFNYKINEALHVSDEEKLILFDCIRHIENEYSRGIDEHTHELILNNLELLLNYSTRFYQRQFNTRAAVSMDIVQRFEGLLIDYFSDAPLIDKGLPNVGYFASRLNLSSNYLADILQRYTGKTTQEYIHLALIDKAKDLIWDKNKTVREIAFALGFQHPAHFTRLFKSKTGYAPSEYRHLN